tara:strand:+ start:17901 stop:19301 length:1401 start_codon:yes stop_codon:yes gene_type:complete
MISNNLKRLLIITLFFSVFIGKSQEKILPNFIFYFADDQDQLDYGAYGNPKVHTPAVDQLVKEGMKFTNFYTSQSICAPSRSQLFTGMYPVKNGCMANHLPVKKDLKTVIDYLGARGYEVVLAGKSHVKPNSVFKWTHYFDSVDHRYLPLEAIDSYLATVKTPFCLFVTSDFPHGPYPKDSQYTKKDIYKLPYHNNRYVPNYKPGYYQNIKDDNTQLEAVIKMVDSHNLRDNSVFIYASDHGISGKWGVSEQGLRIPFVVRWPGVVAPGSSSQILLSLVDVLPTFLDISASKIPSSIDGKSFYKTLKGNESSVNDYIFSLATRQNIQACKVFPTRAVRDARFKFIRNYNALEVYASNLGTNPVVNSFIKIGAESFSKVPFEELYDLEIDPFQKNNLIKNPKYHSIKNQLSDVLYSWMLSQDDFLISNKMPLLKPTLHPLDRNSKWNKVSTENLKGLGPEDYLKSHY